MRFTIPANMAGVPALSIPIGHSSSGGQHAVDKSTACRWLSRLTVLQLSGNCAQA